MTWNTVVNYLQAGLDESLAKFVKGMFASALMGAALYAYHHIDSHTLSVAATFLTTGIGTPGLIAFWHWVKTTASDTPTLG